MLQSIYGGSGDRDYHDQVVNWQNCFTEIYQIKYKICRLNHAASRRYCKCLWDKPWYTETSKFGVTPHDFLQQVDYYNYDIFTSGLI